MKRHVKRVLPERLRLWVRRFGRVRWITKAKALRSNGAGAWSGRPARQLRYVLWDPEVDTFTYPLANLDELAERLSGLLDEPVEEVSRHLRAALEDPELGPELGREIGWRVLFSKRRPPLPSHHLSAWAIIRIRKPRLVVETGILEGLGDRVILRALQLNAAEGSPGALMAFDVMAGAGRSMVPPRLRDAWQPIYEPTPEALDSHLGEHRVGLFLHDSVPEPGHLRAEVDAVLPRMAPDGILMTVHGWTGVLEDMVGETGGSHETFTERPADHFYPGRTVSWLRLPADT